MKEDKDNSLFNILLGIAIGATIVWLIFGNKQKSTTPSNQQQLDLSFIEKRLVSLEQSIRDMQSIPITSSIAQSTTYKNSEKTSFILNKEGDIIGMETTRDANIGEKNAR